MSKLLAVGTKVSIRDYFKMRDDFNATREILETEIYEGRKVQINRHIIWDRMPSIMDAKLPIEVACVKVYRHGYEVSVNGNHYTSAANMEHAEGIVRRWKRDVDISLDNTY